MKRFILIATLLLAGAGCVSVAPPKPTPEPSPAPEPVPIGTECRSYASCQNDAPCPSGTECSGLPAYGCYPPGCPTPICLASSDFISAPDGEIRVTELREGMNVWTLDPLGNKVAEPILKISRTPVLDDHEMIHLVLEDRREVWASPGHPLADGRGIETLQIGDALDGSTVKTIESVPYWDDATYDILPDGGTGSYWANGILLDSTLQ